ncbi:agmatinase [Jannaschia sp. Os4]|uniref:agmatinase n=1 Tax=Jannaschia sp. Os4 TaxID=2807617 RepID=UPI001939D392|nr:agmatinase [Jannaschia sp. Os4]MBM2576428.1 agmatinase [Jannaschia sp. Os4]
MTYRPVSGMDLARFAGIPTFMRLPHVPADDPRRAEVDIGLIGMPWDGGTSNRPGARHGPRSLRDASTMVREMNRATGQVPYDHAAIADLGDAPMSPVDQDEALDALAATVATATGQGIRPLSVGGDHLCTLAMLRGLARAGAPTPGLVLLDSHTDLYPPYFGGRTLTHGNPFRQAAAEGLIDPHRSTMIGMRGTAYDTEDFDHAADLGIEIVTTDAMLDRGLAATAALARDRMDGGPAYLSFDIDFIDPAFAPGTGTPEVGGPTSNEALRITRALHGVDLIGADLVEVSPPFDTGGITAWLGASVLFELLCLMVPRS